MILEVNGTDLAPYVLSGGVKWQRNDLDSGDAGRTMDGTMHRERVGMKIRLDIQCRPLRSSESALVLNAIVPEFVTVRYTDPKDGVVTKTMYSNNVPATHLVTNNDGTDVWDGIAFPLIER